MNYRVDRVSIEYPLKLRCIPRVSLDKHRVIGNEFPVPFT